MRILNAVVEVFTAMTKRSLLASVMLGLMVLLMAVACGGAESENSNQKPTVTNEYPSSGAIAEAKALELGKKGFRFFKDEAKQFGLYLWSSDENEYKQIRNRLLTNDELASALRTVDDEGMTAFLNREFYVGTGYVDINIDATDQEIIEFLITATPEAKAKKVALSKLKEDASQFGLHVWLSDEDKYNEIRDRLFANDELASALRTADDEGVVVYLGREFRVGTGYVFINIEATDQEIIEFLLGK